MNSISDKDKKLLSQVASKRFQRCNAIGAVILLACAVVDAFFDVAAVRAKGMNDLTIRPDMIATLQQFGIAVLLLYSVKVSKAIAASGLVQARQDGRS